MSLLTGAIIVVAAVAVAVAAMLLVRRRAPAGGYFSDADRAAGVFTVLGTGFAVLLGFVIFLAFQSYSGAKQDAEQEATAAIQQFEITRIFGPGDRNRLETGLDCYARSVVAREWPAMAHGRRSTATERWNAAVDRATELVRLAGAKQGAGFDDLLRQAAERKQARQSRLLEARRALPSFLWLVLILGGVLVVGYMLLWADPSERPWVQGALIGSVTALLTASVLLVSFLDTPYGRHRGSIEPTAMRHSLSLMQSQSPRGNLVCDATGAPRAG